MLYDCTEATGSKSICDYNLSTLHGLQDQVRPSRSHWQSNFNWLY